MRIFKNFILILCVISFFNFGLIEKVSASEELLPQKQANIAFLGFPDSGKTVLKTALENSFQTMCQSILSFNDRTVKCNFWDNFNEPIKGEIDDRYKCMDVVVITVALNDSDNDWKKVIRRNVLEWQKEILDINPNAKIILACTKADTIVDGQQLNSIKTSIDNFVNADRDLDGMIQSVVLSVTDPQSVHTLINIIIQNLKDIDIDLLRSAKENVFHSGICYVL